jgi:hypothetical protein
MAMFRRRRFASGVEQPAAGPTRADDGPHVRRRTAGRRPPCCRRRQAPGDCRSEPTDDGSGTRRRGSGDQRAEGAPPEVDKRGHLHVWLGVERGREGVEGTGDASNTGFPGCRWPTAAAGLGFGGGVVWRAACRPESDARVFPHLGAINGGNPYN